MSDETNQSGLKPASDQTAVAAADLLNSVNCGVIVHRTGAIKAEFRSEGRVFARDLAEYINTTKVGIASAYVYEETFGTKDRIHWLIHISDLGAYETMVRMGNSDPEFRDLIFKQRISEEKGGGGWDRIFMDGSLTETVLLPQFFGMYGTTMENEAGLPNSAKAVKTLPPASTQTDVPEACLLNSATAGIVMLRSAKLKSRYRGEGRAFGRAVAASINETLPGRVSAFLYEEAFGMADRIHWLIHMEDLTAYYDLINMHTAGDPKIIDIYTREWITPEKGGGNWAKIFLDGGFEDMALTPQHWNMYATKR